MARDGGDESSSNAPLWLWVPDLRALRARLSGTTAEFVGTADYRTVNSTGIEKLIDPFLISSGTGGNGEA
ncbi:hypothetical protein TM233_03250 [Bradyrhizobium sp. TM233]|nr:hypothetical protein TM233_03250 [Bradyrhizobium sp. TM233]